ncbi:hypothetical protein Tco_0179423 [Tanacetum coccineum]
MSQSPNTQPISTAEEAVPMPHESLLHSVHSLGRNKGSVSLNELTDLCTSLSKKVGALENELQQTKKTYKDENDVDDSSKQGRKIFEIDTYPSISLVQDEGPLWFQEDAEIQEKISDDTEVLLEEEEPTEIVEDQVTTAEVSTATENLLYIRRSAEKKKDKGKGIMTEPEPEKKPKKQLEQERFGHEEAVEVARQNLMKKYLRIKQGNAEIARQLQRYHAQLNRPYPVAEVRKNMVMYLKKHGGYKMNYFKGMKYEDIRPIFEKKAGGSRKKTLARKRAGEKQSDQSAKRQKTEYEKEKEELKAYLDLVPREEFSMEIESLTTKYPIVDWKTPVLIETFMYYQIIRADGGSKNYKIFNEILDDFDRHDVMDLHRLVEERYATLRPEGYDLMLWGDLEILFQPDEEDKVWKHQHEYNLIS